MLSKDEKIILQNYDKLDKKDKAKANFNYRVSHKVKKILSELGEVNEVLGKIPEKTTASKLDNNMVADLFALTETLLRIMRFAPVVLDIRGDPYITRFGPGKPSKTGITEYTVKMELATSSDVFRQILVKEHIKKLQQFIDSSKTTLPNQDGAAFRPLALTGTTSLAVAQGLDEYAKLGRKGLGPWSEMFGFE